MISFPWDSIVLGFDQETGFPLYDRGYKAEQLRTVLMKVFSQGVFDEQPDAFVVTENEGMSVLVSPGTCHIQGDIGVEDSTRQLVFTAASSLPRIDTVVLRWDNNIDARNIDLYVKQGVAAEVPVRPSLTRAETVWELGICDIFIPANSTAISGSRITDTRLETARCGIVTPFTTIDTTTFYNQIQAAIRDKLANIDELANFTYLDGGFYAVHVEIEGKERHLYAYYDEKDNPPPLSLEEGRLIYTVNEENRLDLGRVDAMPAGCMMQWAGTDAPKGWLLCQGQAVSREDYSLLFDAIGTTYGAGDGSTTFNIPDMRDRFAIGVGTSTAKALNAKGGEATHKLTTAEMPSHNHTVPWGQTSGEASGYGLAAEAGFKDRVIVQRSGYNSSTSSTGSGTAHNNIPPYIGLNFIISTGE